MPQIQFQALILMTVSYRLHNIRQGVEELLQDGVVNDDAVAGLAQDIVPDFERFVILRQFQRRKPSKPVEPNKP
jgi:hypothetical protein